MKKETQLQVEAIKNGTVIDIPAQVGIKVLKLFAMDESKQRVTIGLNLPSSALGYKDLLRIENTFINEQQANKLALYAPHATVNQIEDYRVVKKLALALPEFASNVFEVPKHQLHYSHSEPSKNAFSRSLKKITIYA